jgi:hypothetical protein
MNINQSICHVFVILKKQIVYELSLFVPLLSPSGGLEGSKEAFLEVVELELENQLPAAQAPGLQA